MFIAFKWFRLYMKIPEKNPVKIKKELSKTFKQHWKNQERIVINLQIALEFSGKLKGSQLARVNSLICSKYWQRFLERNFLQQSFFFYNVFWSENSYNNLFFYNVFWSETSYKKTFFLQCFLERNFLQKNFFLQRFLEQNFLKKTLFFQRFLE